MAGTVTKGGTKAYKEVTFSVTDARFANGLASGADFYLDSRAPNGAADGDEWVHQVAVERVDDPVAATDTPAPAPTETATTTPSATPTETVTLTPTVEPTPILTSTATRTATPTARASPPVFLPLVLQE